MYKKNEYKHGISRGFTLMELLVVVTIAAILVTVAYPNFMNVVRKSRRAEALEVLMLLQLRQERYRTNNPSYATLAQLGISATTSSGNYTLSISNPTATGYTATATAVAGTTQVKDKERGTSCAVLQVNQDEAVYTPAAQVACWNR